MQLSELGAVAEDVRKGETVEVRDGEKVVAQVVPHRQQTIEERVAELESQGKIRRGKGEFPEWFLEQLDSSALTEKVESGETTELVQGEKTVARELPVHELVIPKGTVPDWFFDEPPPKFPGSVLEQLLHDRHSRDW